MSRFTILAGLTLFSSCGLVAVIDSIVLTPSEKTILVGKTVQMTATFKDKDGNELTARKTTWSSSDTSVATVDSDGLVTGVASGSATISATVGTVAGTASISVSSDKILYGCDTADQFTFTDIGVAVEASTAGFASTVNIADTTAVVLSDGTVRMYFMYMDSTGSLRGHMSAVSSDGTTFTSESGDRIAYDSGTWGPHVKAKKLSDGSIRIYKGATPTSDTDVGIISYVTTDGLTLTKEDGFRITPSDAGLSRLSHLTIVTMADGTYRGYFSNMPSGSTADLVVKSATSTDLLSWTVDSGVRAGTGATTLSTYSAEQPHALQRGDGCVTLFYYSTYDLSAAGPLVPPSIHYSTSADGTTFSTEYSLGVEGNGPDIIRLNDGSYLLYYDVGGSTSNPGKIRVGKLELK